MTVRAGGDAMVNVEITEQSQRDLLLMESLAIPISFLVLVWVFGGALAAAVPLAVGGMAILGALAVLRGVTYFTDVSIFALNLSAAMGLALAIDYTLADHQPVPRRAGRRCKPRRRTGSDHGDGGPHRAVLGHDRGPVDGRDGGVPDGVPQVVRLRGSGHRRVRRIGGTVRHARGSSPTRRSAAGVRHWSTGRAGSLNRQEPVGRTVEQHALYRWTKTVMRHALPAGLAVVALLLLLGAPFLGVRWGFPDDRVLPKTASAHQVGDEMRTEFPDDSATAVTIVVPDASGLTQAEIDRYTTDLAGLPDVAGVSPGPGLPTAART